MLARSMPVTSMKAKADSIGDLPPYYEIQNHQRVRFASAVPVSQSESASPMTSVRARTLDPLTDSAWDDLVARHPRSSVFHQRGWLEALAQTYGYRPVAFTTSPPNGVLKNGLLFCQINSWLTGSRLVSLPFSDHCDPLCDSPDEMISLADGCQALLDEERRQYIEVRPTDEDLGRTCSKAGFQPVGHYFLHVLDLSPNLETLFQSFDKDSVQRRIRRAERASLIEKCGTSPELLQDFYRLFVITRGRHHLPPPPFAWFQNLVQCQGNTLEIRVAYHNGSAIAAILTLRFREIGYFKYGCSDARFNKFGATPWLLWRAIAAAKGSGALAFDLGRTQQDNAGLLAFKDHWARNHQRLVYWRFPGGPSRDGSDGWKLKIAKRVFSCMPKRLLAASGKLIYRHIG
ncbi:MAG: GNAT family N-acetyltransferase [Candidatus Acidiferrales bacterium]